MSSRKMSVLVVDDDIRVLRMLQRMLEIEGYRVLTASNGEAALNMFDEETPVLVLLDIMMPDMDGYEVCRRLRSDPGTAALPVLMFSAKGSSADRKNGFQVGANDFMVKSAGPRALVVRIRSLLSDSLSNSDGMPLRATCC